MLKQIRSLFDDCCLCVGTEGGIRWAYGELNALGCSAETSVLVVGDTYCVFLGVALRVISSSFSLGDVNSFEDSHHHNLCNHIWWNLIYGVRDGTLDGEGSVLGLDCEWSMCCLGAFAAICLANLIVLSIWGGCQWAHLCCLSSLLKVRAVTCTETWQLAELAWAIEGSELECAGANFRNVTINCDISTSCGCLLSKILGFDLAESSFEGRCWSSSHGSCKECNDKDRNASHLFDVCSNLLYLRKPVLSLYKELVTIISNSRFSYLANSIYSFIYIIIYANFLSFRSLGV